MKLSIQLKDPDGVYDSLAGHGMGLNDINDPQTDEQCAARDVVKKFVQYDEYVTIELDTETCEARVVPVR